MMASWWSSVARSVSSRCAACMCTCVSNSYTRARQRQGPIENCLSSTSPEVATALQPCRGVRVCEGQLGRSPSTRDVLSVATG